MSRKEAPDPMALHGTISPVDGKMWDGREGRWVTPTAEGLAYAKERGAGIDPHRAEFLSRITTLQSLPGHTIRQSLGVVTILTAASGLTAGVKGNEALDKAHRQLLAEAQAIGANAIVGLTSSTFGAGGGITSVLGGDAVGVMLMGTAVVVEPDEPGA